MSERLHIFAVNAALDLCHTHYSRAQGGPAPDLPPLSEWLGAAVDTDEIELFTLKDIGDLRLSDYVDMAFAPEDIPSDAARRMNALDGSVLLVPDRALDGPPHPGPMLSLIATLHLAQADHRARLPKADLRQTGAAPAPASAKAPGRGALPVLVLLALGLIVLVTIWVL